MSRNSGDEQRVGPVHSEILDMAYQCCGEGWMFKVIDVIHALPHLNANTVRTHITSRCCVNAPPHHDHRWPYFRRVGWGIYEIMPSFRGIEPESASARH